MNRKYFLAISCVLVVGISMIFGGKYLLQKVRYSMYVTRSESALEAISLSIQIELNSYYRRHKEYPHSLNQIQITYSDGATPDMLGSFAYSSNHNTCRLTYTRPSISGGPLTITAEFENGIKIREVHKKDGRIVWEG